MRGRRFVGCMVVCACAALLPSCSTSSFRSSAPTPSTTVVATTMRPTVRPALGTTSSTRPDEGARDAAFAQKAVLNVGDVPSGWTSDAGSGPAFGSLNPTVVGFAACLRVAPRSVALGDLPHYTATLRAPTGGGVRATVAMFPDVVSARAAFTAVSSPRAPSCKAAEILPTLRLAHWTSDAGAFFPTGIAGRTSAIRITERAPGAVATEDWLFAQLGSAFVELDVELKAPLGPQFETGLLARALAHLRDLGQRDDN